MRAFTTNRCEGEVTPSEGTPVWIPLAEVGHLRPLLANTAEIVQAAARLLKV